jgi:sulfate adenylyltransferase subunit 2
MLYAIGKDSAVMLHLVRKAFYPAPPPLPLLHIDTRWKFQEMYRFRDLMARESGMDLLVHINPQAISKDINPFDHGPALHTEISETEGLKQALNRYQFDLLLSGARRDEAPVRAKERIFSLRAKNQHWDPQQQRAEPWNLYNTRKKPGESLRVFPLSNWTELDIWQYIYQVNIPLVPLYFAKERPVINRNGRLLLIDDERMRLLPDDKIEARRIRFRSLGCYPLVEAVESQAASAADILLELLASQTSERQGHGTDSASTEKQKQEGYF